MTTENRIRLTESTDARNARLWGKFRTAADAFTRHITLIEWQDGKGEADKFKAWQEGEAGLQARIAKGVPGYENLIAEKTAR